MVGRVGIGSGSGSRSSCEHHAVERIASSDSECEIVTPVRATHRNDKPAMQAESQLGTSTFVAKHGLIGNILEALRKRFPISTPSTLSIGSKLYLCGNGKWSKKEGSAESGLQSEEF